MSKRILDFWFHELEAKDWFVSSDKTDALIKERFADLVEQAAQCELDSWRKTPQGRLAEIILLDQFSRNIYRDTPQAFSQDPLALALAQQAIEVGADKSLSLIERSFLYMPFMHSESIKIHQQAVVLFDQPGLENNYDFELKHKVIIEQFGRYPHRNAILGRISTPDELAFLDTPNSSF
ncbi:DUF924 domain-containing protein [Vibrio sinensis]|uniref:DUF924 domain-containing protein n=1 Tax=Vibrio sinensis TaxID=2302434 RepID=A0A3A6QKV2_9VIBR|nr:DUF924 family protein [Vibrio sinensis]RJX70948.1 DUF924 domain-containing protein [Vibrio sinensis]